MKKTSCYIGAEVACESTGSTVRGIVIATDNASCRWGFDAQGQTMRALSKNEVIVALCNPDGTAYDSPWGQQSRRFVLGHMECWQDYTARTGVISARDAAAKTAREQQNELFTNAGAKLLRALLRTEIKMVVKLTRDSDMWHDKRLLAFDEITPELVEKLARALNLLADSEMK